MDTGNKQLEKLQRNDHFYNNKKCMYGLGVVRGVASCPEIVPERLASLYSFGGAISIAHNAHH